MADPTFICTQSKAYLARASRDLIKLIRSREAAKDDKHGPGLPSKTITTGPQLSEPYVQARLFTHTPVARNREPMCPRQPC